MKKVISIVLVVLLLSIVVGCAVNKSILKTDSRQLPKANLNEYEENIIDAIMNQCPDGTQLVVAFLRINIIEYTLYISLETSSKFALLELTNIPKPGPKYLWLGLVDSKSKDLNVTEEGAVGSYIFGKYPTPCAFFSQK